MVSLLIFHINNTYIYNMLTVITLLYDWLYLYLYLHLYTPVPVCVIMTKVFY